MKRSGVAYSCSYALLLQQQQHAQSVQHMHVHAYDETRAMSLGDGLLAMSGCEAVVSAIISGSRTIMVQTSNSFRSHFLAMFSPSADSQLQSL